jgi:hypothetical protein
VEKLADVWWRRRGSLTKCAQLCDLWCLRVSGPAVVRWQMDSEELPTPDLSPAKPVPPRKFGLSLVVVGIFLVGTYAVLVATALAGQKQQLVAGPSAVVWTGLFCYFWWKRYGRRGIVGALVGALVGFSAFLHASAVGGALHGASV